MKYSLKFDDLNLYLCSLTLGLLQYMLQSRNYSLGIWSLGLPMFQDSLESKGVDKRLIEVIEEFDELEVMSKLGIDVDTNIKDKIETISQVMTELNCYNRVNQIKLEKEPKDSQYGSLR